MVGLKIMLYCYIIKHLDTDLSETHLEENKGIDIENYIWIGHNRSIKHVNAPKTFGGTGLLIKSHFHESYSVNVIDKSYDGISVVMFLDKQTDFSFIIFSCYLPPEGSVYADATSFFAHILTLLYLHQDVDLMFICGDFNGCIGKRTDVSDVHDLPSRKVIDD